MNGSRTWAKADLAAGLLTAALGAAVVIRVRSFPQLPGGAPGPALFPGLVGALLVLFGVVLLVRSVRTTRQPPGDEAEDTTASGAPGKRGVVNAVTVLAAVLIYIVVADLLGFAITMAALVAALMLRLGARPLVGIGAAVATTVVMALIFERLLLVPLPTGPLGF